MRKKLGLALGSGGSRGVAHVGFLQALEESGIKADFVTGCSMGSIVGACYCAGVSPAQMKEAALSLKLSRIASLNIAPITSNGLLKMNKARKLLEDMIGNKTFQDLDIPFACVATDLAEGSVAELSEGNVIDAIIASSSIPGAFTPAQIGERKLLVDGGILERVPTKELKNMGAEVIVAVDVLGDLTVKKMPSNLVDTLLRCIDIMDTRTTQRKRQARRYVDLWLEPDLGAMEQYKVKNLAFAYEKGYELGKENIKEIKALIGK